MDIFARPELMILDMTRQTTLSRKLSTLLDVKHLSMDALWWKPGWQTSTREEFQDELRKFFGENEEHQESDTRGLFSLFVLSKDEKAEKA